MERRPHQEQGSGDGRSLQLWNTNVAWRWQHRQGQFMFEEKFRFSLPVLTHHWQNVSLHRRAVLKPSKLPFERVICTSEDFAGVFLHLGEL